ncbi:MAG: phosphohydrolase [Candidatus Hydrogenedentota bacterium]
MSDDSRSEDAPRDILIHIADLHFWHVSLNPAHLLNKRALGNLNVFLRRRHAFDMARAHAHIEFLGYVDSRQLLLTGDFASTSLDREFERARTFVDALRSRGYGIHLMPGNHDVYTFEAQRKKRFEQHFANLYPPEGFPCRRDLAGGTPLVMVPTVCPNLLSSRGRITPEEVSRTAELVRGAGPTSIVAGHYPLLDETPGYHTTRERRLRNAETLREALGACGHRILYVAGHVHRFSFVRDAKYPNLEHVTTGTFFGRNPRENLLGEFAEVQVLPNGFKVVRHTIGPTGHRRFEQGPPPLAG